MSSETPARIERVSLVAVIGAGTMGHGIAQVAAQAGYRVRLYDVSDDAVKAGRSRIEKNLEKGVTLGKVEPADRDATLERISVTTELAEAARGADVVIEAAPEKLELKQSIFGQVAEVVAPDAVLASNTSSLSVATIAESLPAPGRVVGMHFFNPVHIMKLVEVVKHAGSDGDAVQCAVDLAEKMRKTPITVTDAPGFASSRLGLILGLEAMRMVEQGVASAADIDTAMKLGYGHPMGPLELTDLVGLDVRLHIADYLAEHIGEHFRPPAILRQLVDEGRLGKKSGHGFYRWQNGKKV